MVFLLSSLLYIEFREVLQPLCHRPQPFIHEVVDSSFFEGAVGLPLTRPFSRENLHALINGLYWIDVEFTLLRSLYYFLLQHEVLYVTCGDEYTLLPRKSLGFTDLEEPFNLLVHAADCLYFSLLIHGACDSETLSEGDT